MVVQTEVPKQALEPTVLHAVKGKQKKKPADKLAYAAYVIENLPDEKAALAKMDELLRREGFTDFEIGGVLSVLRMNKWYNKYANFAALCQHQFGFSVRKAEYLIRIYIFLLEGNVPTEELEQVGWTKVRILCGAIDPKNLKDWLPKAKTMSSAQIAQALKATASQENLDQLAKTTTTLTFKPHADQLETIKAALDKAKEAGNTTYDTVALEYVCLDYLGTPVAKEAQLPAMPAGTIHPMFSKPSIKELSDDAIVVYMRNVGSDMAIDLFVKAFPGWQIAMIPPE